MNGPMELNAVEAWAMALRLTAGHRVAAETWLHREDHPQLSEAAFERLVWSVGLNTQNLDRIADQYDRSHRVDSAALIERTSS